jgi:hypothetical protein
MLGLLVGIAFAVSKVLQRRDDEILAATAPAPTWPPITERATAEPERAAHVEQAVAKKQQAPKKAAAKKAPAKKSAPAASARPWVDPVDGVCPTTHPVKGKLSSKLFHLPGMLAYERTKPDRCYLDPAAAEADGLTRAKR